MKQLIRKMLLHLFRYAVPELFTQINLEIYRQRDKEEWRSRNSHNSTQLMLCMCPLAHPNQVLVGHHVYGNLNVYSWGGEEEGLIIGNYCSIAKDVRFLLGGNHYMNHFSSYPFRRMVLGQVEQEATTKGKIIVEDDVWIGLGATILSGVTLRRGTVVAAGSMVTKSTEPYSVVGGNPAKLIRYRFEKPVIKQLLSVDFRKITDSFIRENIDKLYNDNPTDIQYLIEQLSKK